MDQVIIFPLKLVAVSTAVAPRNDFLPAGRRDTEGYSYYRRVTLLSLLHSEAFLQDEDSRSSTGTKYLSAKKCWGAALANLFA